MLEALYDSAIVLALTLGGGIALIGHSVAAAGWPGVLTGPCTCSGVRATRRSWSAVHGLPNIRAEQRFGSTGRAGHVRRRPA